MASWNAACSCGELRLTVTGEPVRISLCHCLACQRRTGSAFGVQARLREAGVHVEGGSESYVRVADSGNRMTSRFCPDCGSTVCYAPEQEPDLVAVPVGAFADPSFPAPRTSVYEARQHPRVGLPENMDHYD